MGQSTRWTRDDYARMINMYGYSDGGKKAKRRRRRRQGGGRSTLHEAMLLGKMLGNRRGNNRKSREAIIDSMSNKQMNDLGKVMARALARPGRAIPKSRIKQLIKDRKFITAIIKGQGPLSLRKKILKQRGGFLGSLIGALAAPLIEPVIGTIGTIVKAATRR